MRTGDEYWLIRKSGDSYRAERHRDNDDFWRAVILAGIILMRVIAF